MSTSPDPSNAPSFLGQTPPDRVQMSFQEHLNAIINTARSGAITPDDFASLRATLDALQEIFTELAGAQGQEGEMPPGPSRLDAGNEVDPGYDPEAVEPTYAE